MPGRTATLLDPQSDLYANLVLALRRFGDPGLPLAVAPRRMRFIVVAAALRMDEDSAFIDVAPCAAALLNETYSFAKRAFAQDVVLSEIIALLQSVAGVAAVRVDGFGLVDECDGNADENPPPTDLKQLGDQIKAIAGQTPVPSVLIVSSTRRGSTGIRAAEIALLSPRVPQTLILNEWKP